VLLLHFSGHGTQICGQDGTICGEALVPWDAEDKGSYFDHELRDTEFEKLILDNTPPHVTLYIVMDCGFDCGNLVRPTSLRNIAPPNQSLGTNIRAVRSRGFIPPKEGQGVESTMESRLRAVSNAKPNVISFIGGAKFEPVVDAMFNYTGYGVFSYFFYSTLKNNKQVRNINLIDSVRSSIKNANFVQQPQLIVAREDMQMWTFLSSITGEEANIMLPGNWGTNATRTVDDWQMQEWRMLDAAATLEVDHTLGMHRKRGGQWAPFVVQDIARVIAGIAGRTVLKLAQQRQGFSNNSAFSLALLAINDCARRVLELLLPSPVAQNRAPISHPTMQDLINNVVLTSVRTTIASHLPSLSKDERGREEEIQVALRDSCAWAQQSIMAALAQPVDRVIRLAEEVRDIAPVTMPNNLPESREIINNAFELAKQIIITVAADIYSITPSTSLPPNMAPLATSISTQLNRAFSTDFINKLVLSKDPQRKVEKLCLIIMQGIARDYHLAVAPQDLADRVEEITARFGDFVHLAPNAGQTLLRARRTDPNASAIPLAESLIESICASAVDDSVTRSVSPVSQPPSSFQYVAPVPDMYKVVAYSVAEMAARSVLDVLKMRNAQNLSAGTLCAVLRSVAKIAATATLSTLSKGVDPQIPWGPNIPVNSNRYTTNNISISAFVPLAMSAAKGGLTKLAPGHPEIASNNVDQLIANCISASAPRYLRSLPYLGVAMPLINTGVQAIGSPQGKRADTWNLAQIGAEILAAAFASLVTSTDTQVEFSVANTIVKDAVVELISKPEAPLVENVTKALQHAMRKQNIMPKLSHTVLQEEVAHTYSLFAPFTSTHVPFATSQVPAHTFADVFTGTASSTAQHLSQRAAPPFMVELGKAVAQVAAGSLLDVLQSQGILDIPPRKLNKRIRSSATQIATALISETFSSPTSTPISPNLPSTITSSTTVLSATIPSIPSIPPTTTPLPTSYSPTMIEHLMGNMVPAVAKAAQTIIMNANHNKQGSIVNPSNLMTESACAVAKRMRTLSTHLPLLSTVSPPLMNSVAGKMSYELSQKGRGTDNPEFNSAAERAGLATLIAMCETRGNLQYQSGHVNDDVIGQAVERAMQYTRENQGGAGGSVEQAIKRAIDSFGFQGDGMGSLSEDYLRRMAKRSSHFQRVPSYIPNGIGSQTKGIAPQQYPLKQVPTQGYGAQVGPHTHEISTSDVERITQHVLSLYSFAPGYNAAELRVTVIRTVSYIVHYPALSHYPRNFILECAKMGGCVAAREHLRLGAANSPNACTTGLAVVAQLLLPSPSAYQQGQGQGYIAIAPIQHPLPPAI
jgi:hypothetical protein